MVGWLGGKMLVAINYEFDERLGMSQSESSNGDIKQILVEHIPSAVAAFQSHSANDRSGVDWWVECRNGKLLGVDCKVREEDWAAKPEPWRADDVALETWSVVESSIVGWTRDTNKQTDYVLWLWRDTGRWMLVPFQMLCKVFLSNWQSWSGEYKTRRQKTPGRNGRRGYHSECVFVPRRELWAEIYRQCGGACD